MPDPYEPVTAAQLRTAYDVLRVLIHHSIGDHAGTDFHVLSAAKQLVHEQILVLPLDDREGRVDDA
jgi:hypothetical protein